MDLRIDRANPKAPFSSMLIVLNNAKLIYCFLVFSFSDGLLEVVGLYSSLHIAKVRVNLAEPVILGQARNVEVRLRHSICQMD